MTPLINCNPSSPLNKVARKKFTVTVNLAWAQAQPPAPEQLAVYPLLPSSSNWGAQHAWQRGGCMLCLGKESRPQRPMRVAKEGSRTRWGILQEKAVGSPGKQSQLHSSLSGTMDALVFWVFSRKDECYTFRNKTAPTKVVSTPHSQLKYPAQQLFNSLSMRRGWWYSCSSQQCWPTCNCFWWEAAAPQYGRLKQAKRYTCFSTASPWDRPWPDLLGSLPCPHAPIAWLGPKLIAKTR